MASTRKDLQEAIARIRVRWRAKVLSPLAATQKAERKDKEAKGPIYVSRVVISAPPEDDARQLLFQAIQDLALRGEKVEYDAPPAADLRAEWLAPRRSVPADAPEPQVSERQKYDLLCKENGEAGPVIFYLFGGNMTFGDPVAYRSYLKRLSSATSMRTYCVAYRLAPKHTFPTALLDVFLAYLNLIAPPPGAYHRPVPARQVIFAGDSFGCSLALSVIQLLLYVQRTRDEQQQHVFFHGHRVRLEQPAGVAGNSGYCDFTVSLPSERVNADRDIFPETLVNPFNWVDRSEPELDWPSNPPRHDFACYQSALDHPLLSPLAATNWTGAPPMWISMGDERPLDCMKVIAQRAHADGVTVTFAWYRDMPHCWIQFLPQFKSAQKAHQSWAKAIRDIAAGKLESRAASIDAWTLAETALDPTQLVSFPLEHVAPMMRMEKQSRHLITGRSTRL